MSSLSSSDYSKSAGTGDISDRGISRKRRQYIAAVPADRRLFPGRDEQGAGCEEEQSDVCTGGRFPADAKCHQQRTDRGRYLERSRTEAFQGGWNKVKLYFMLGLPREDGRGHGRDRAAFRPGGAKNYYEIPKEQRHGKCQITASTSFFVPKPFTPFQWAQMSTAEEYPRKSPRS